MLQTDIFIIEVKKVNIENQNACEKNLKLKRWPKDTIAGGYRHIVGLKSDGTVVAVGRNEYGQCNVSSWRDIVSVAVGCAHTLGLKSDGTVVAVGRNNENQCEVSGWCGIQLPGN